MTTMAVCSTLRSHTVHCRLRATSVLCLLGIGVGLGSLLLYRIYTRIFPRALPAPPCSGQKRPLSRRCARCGRLEGGSPQHKRRAVVPSPELLKANQPKGDTLSPQSDQGYCTEGGVESGQRRKNSPICITPDSPSTVIGGLADISLCRKQRRPSQDSVVTRAQSWECDDGDDGDEEELEEGDRLPPVFKRCPPPSSVFSEPTDISRPSTNRNSIYSSYSSSDLGFSSGLALDSMDGSHAFSDPELMSRPSMPRSQASHRANLGLDLGSTTSSPAQSNDSPSTIMGSPNMIRRHNHQRNLSSSSLTERNIKAYKRASGMDFQTHDPGDVCECESGTYAMPEDYADFHMVPNMHSSPAHLNSINNNGLESDYSTNETDEIFLAHRPHNFSSDIGASSELSMKEYLLNRYSADLEENLSGLSTPDSEGLGGDEFGLSTVANIEKIQFELQQIQQDMDEMSNEVYKLNSRENLSDEDNIGGKSHRRWKSDRDCSMHRRSSKRRRTGSRSQSLSQSGSVDSFYSESFMELGTCDYRKESTTSVGDYMWDYQSDLLAGSQGRISETFVAKRPCFRQSLRPSSATSSGDTDSSPSCGSCDSRITGSGLSDNRFPQSWENSSSWMVENVGRKYNLFEYAEKHWGKNSCDAKTMKKGLQRIPSLLGMSQLRPVRRDHFCLLRAVLYQVLVNRLPVHPYLASWKHTHKRLEILQQTNPHYLQQWTFANRLPYRRDQLYEHAVECVQCLYEQMSVLGDIEDSASRENQLLQNLNAHPQLDLQLLEGCKLLMFLHSLQLHEDLQAGRPTTLFARLLFSIEGATSPELLLRNYLNPLGDTMKMQRLHLYLLGHTLGVKIQVIQPSALSCNDFVAHYPDDGADTYPKIYLLQEEDGHYDVLSP